MVYVMVGLACSTLGCEWWKPAFNDGQTFDTERACMDRVAEVRPKQIMFFDMKCEPIKPGAQS
jgi:predicted exporter